MLFLRAGRDIVACATMSPHVRRLRAQRRPVEKRSRGWLRWLGEVVQALLADPVLLAPAVLVVVVAVLAAYLVWRFT